jgi:flagellar protein FliL
MSVTTTVLSDAPGSEDSGSQAKKSRKKLVIVAVVVLVLLAVGGFVGKGMLAAPAKPEPDPKTVAGVVVTLAPITMNLADGRYLKLTLALQLSKAASPVAGSVDAAAGAVPVLDGAKALDAAITVLGKRYDGDVLGVYFTEFLMQ